MVSFLHCLFEAHRATELESDEKSSFWKGKKLLPVQFCSFREGGGCIYGLTCLPLKLPGIPAAWAMAFSMHFLSHECWIFPKHSLSYVTTDSMFVWVCYQQVASCNLVLPWQKGSNISGPMFAIQVLEQVPQRRGEVLILGISRVSQSFSLYNSCCYGVSWSNQELWK